MKSQVSGTWWEMPVKRRIVWCSGNTIDLYSAGGRFESQVVYPILWVSFYVVFQPHQKSHDVTCTKPLPIPYTTFAINHLPSTLHIPKYWRHFEICNSSRCSSLTVPFPVRRRRPVWRVRQSSHHRSCPRTGYAGQVVIVSNHVLCELALVFIYCIHKYRLSLQTC